MASKIGNLWFALTADSSDMRRALRKAEGDLTKTKTKFNRTAAQIDRGFGRLNNSVKNFTRNAFGMQAGLGALIGVAGAGGMIALAKRSIETADSIAKTADKVGLTTDALQELRFAASQSGVEISTFDMAMQRFSRRVGEAANGGGELKDTLERLGIQVRDSQGNVRKLDEILDDFGKAIKNAKSEQEALSIAFKGFDSEGAKLVNLFRSGTKSLADYRAEARALGIVIEEDLIRNAEESANKMDAMSKIIDAKLTKAFLNLTPQINASTDALIWFSQNFPRGLDFLSSGFDVNAMLGDQAAFNRTQAILDELIKKRERLKEIISSQGSFQAFFDENLSFTSLRGQLDEIDNEIAARTAELEELRTRLAPPAAPTKPQANPIVTGVTLPTEKPDVPTTPTTTAQTDQLREFMEALAQSTELARLDSDAREIREAIMRAENLALAQGKTLTDEQRVAIENYITQTQAARDAQAERADLEASAKQVFEETRTEQERYNTAIEKLNILLQEGLINQDTFNRKVKELQDGLSDTSDTIEEATDNSDQWGNALDDALLNGILKGRDLQDVIADLIVEFGRLLSMQGGGSGSGGIFGSIFGLFGIGGGGGSLASIAAADVSNPLLGGIFAEGGRPPLGKLSLVGEKGPELFVPDTAGTIIPNDQLNGLGGGGTNLTLNLNGVRDFQSFTKNRSRMEANAIAMLRKAEGRA